MNSFENLSGDACGCDANLREIKLPAEAARLTRCWSIPVKSKGPSSTMVLANLGFEFIETVLTRRPVQ